MATERTALPELTCCAGPLLRELSAERAVVLASMFKALGDPVRLRLVSLIAQRAQTCVCDLSEGFDVSGPTLSHHLKVLRQNGIVDCRRAGTWVYYWIRPEALRLLGDLLRLDGRALADDVSEPRGDEAARADQA